MKAYGRTTTDYSSHNTDTLLAALASERTDVEHYRETMKSLGGELARAIVPKVKGPDVGSTICIACTVEDADYLAQGLIDGLVARGVGADKLRLFCFWNERLTRFDDEQSGSFDIAPIVKQYEEPVDLGKAVLVVIKSIISGACVVKTNLSRLIDRAEPEKIFVAAPVMHVEAKKRLEEQFPPSVSERFDFVTFAIDRVRSADGHTVVPGIGGSVYERLGFEDRLGALPSLVLSRRKERQRAA
ncbi:hypothetical protein WL34_10875 [Burkholderia cepacia]|uniref:hypothetical protein n=1 Tax=Burkholderia cepacia TaxID=292 RepID=UPI00075F5083|nr:hypothetical protein [Burkholderia cepacia]KWB39592.1 hypothetical protein WL34_10875 [Burkholderia cepacia]